MNRIIGLINKSTRVPTNIFLAIATAVDAQLTEDFCPDLGIATWRMTTYPNEAAAAAAGAYPLILWDNPDVDGAAGYHVNGSGKAFVSPTLDNGGTLTSGPNSVSVTVSHETMEMIDDMTANFSADMGNGKSTARERCDACESQAYQKNGVFVSDYLMNAWFDADNAQGPYDKLQMVKAPFTMSGSGDYMIITVNGETTQQFGEKYPAWKKALKQKVGRSAELRMAAPPALAPKTPKPKAEPAKTV